MITIKELYDLYSIDNIEAIVVVVYGVSDKTEIIHNFNDKLFSKSEWSIRVENFHMADSKSHSEDGKYVMYITSERI